MNYPQIRVSIAPMLKRAALATIVLSIAGLAVSATIASVHRNLATATGYTSFCNVNESVNCDVVLSSEFAYFAGVPVAWWALLTYAVCIVASISYMATQRATRRKQAATILFFIGAWTLIFSIYLAVVAIAVLKAVCLLCGALYVINAALFVSTWILLGGTRTEGRAGSRAKETWQRRTRLIAVVASLAVVVFLAAALYEAVGGGLWASSDPDPEFVRWYRSLPVTTISDPGRHRKGGPGSVVIVEFSDFQCPHCARAHQDLKRVLPRFGNDVQVVFHHFPLDNSCNPAVPGSTHPYACLAAAASECAAAQGRFWEYHDLLFENQSSLDRDNLIGYADQLGLNRAQFVTCLDSDAPRQAVKSDIALAEKLEITSTPTFFLNGRAVRGLLDAGKFESAVRIERDDHLAGRS